MAMHNYPDALQTTNGKVELSKLQSNYSDISYGYVLVPKTDFIRDYGFVPIGINIISQIAQAVSQGDGSEVDILTTNNVTLYIKVFFGPSEVSDAVVQIRYRNEITHQTYELLSKAVRLPYGNVQQWESFWVFFVEAGPDYYQTVQVIYWADGSGYYGNSTYCTPAMGNVSELAQNTKNFLMGAEIPPVYVWSSWEKIAGNGGQYYAKMTQIKDSVISDADPAAYKVLETGNFDDIAPTSSIWNTYLNALLGEEYTIAWSGNNKATLTVTNHTTNPNIKIFAFKFYLGATLAPFLTAQEEVIVGGEVPGIIAHNYYLSFLYDDDNEVAAFYPVRYMPNGDLVKYAHQVFPALSDVTMQNLYTWLAASEGVPERTGPYDTGTTDNGGTPTGGGHQDPMPTIHTPTLSGAASGMFTIYCPDDSELADIADFLWSDNVLDNFKKYFNNFSDNIIALYVLPYKAANLPTKAFTVGNLQSQTITAVEYITTRFVSVDMGELTVGTRWDSYLDFEPYTKFNIYLPGIGVQALAADDIMCPANMDESLSEAKGSKLTLTYVLDLMTGNIAAYVKINGQIRYQFTGKVGYSIPITGANYNSMVQGYVMATAGLIGTLASGGTAAPFAASAGAAGIINAMKPDVYRGGNASGDSSALCLDYPYLIRRRPNKPYLNEQEIYTGFPSYKSGLLSEFSGFTQVIDAHIEGISCTEAERAEILQLLKSGVIL